MHDDMSMSRQFATLSLTLFVAGLLVPFGLAAVGSPLLAVGFGVTSEALSLIFALLGLAHTPARVALIGNMLLIVGIAGVAALKLSTERTEVVAWLRIRPAVADGGNIDSGYEGYRRTHVQLLMSPRILGSAIEMDGIKELDTIRAQDDPVDWLSKRIKAIAPMDSEIIQLRMDQVMPGKEAADAAKIVNAIVRAYLEHVGADGRVQVIEEASP